MFLHKLGRLIPESLINSEYLDAVYTENENRLIPSDPYDNAQQKLILERFSSKVGLPFIRFIKKIDPEGDKALADALELAVEAQLSADYLGGL